MIAKIRELNLDDLKTVSGGAGQMAPPKAPTSAMQAQAQIAVAPSRPLSAQVNLLVARL
ncbi:MAG: hypothetical protein K2X72_09885 [Reyranella sp.]|nr:hypothetical protein [Reyranella sp.]